jgi:hypothetical protein
MRTGSASGLAIRVDGRAVPPLRSVVRSNVLLDPDRLLSGTAVVRAEAAHAAAPATAPAPAAEPTSEPPPVQPE